MENVGIIYDHLEYFTDIWYILMPFGIIFDIWYIFHLLVCLDQEKSGCPGKKLKSINLKFPFLRPVLTHL
jgi:hypothetical protein